MKNNAWAWGATSFLLYAAILLVGVGVHLFGKKLLIDTDMTDMIALILTSAHGFFAGIYLLIIGGGDFFEYSGIYFLPFVLGGLLWIAIGMLLNNLTKDKKTLKEKLYKSGFLLASIGLFLWVLCMALVVLFSFISKNGFLLLIAFPLSALFVPPFVLGLVTVLIAKCGKTCEI